jgi:Zn finger protein HypA/HybF involved in hydrogenase expression
MVAVSKTAPFTLPLCRHCGRRWELKNGKTAFSSYCEACSSERRKIAQAKLSLRPITANASEGPYLVPYLKRNHN